MMQYVSLYNAASRLNLNIVKYANVIFLISKWSLCDAIPRISGLLLNMQKYGFLSKQ